LAPRRWEGGYATETSIRLLRYGFGELGIERIAGITELANVDSQRALLKSGLVRDGERPSRTRPTTWCPQRRRQVHHHQGC
jgi:RimJ/RimL family protein N-acetyltransferase